MSYSKRININKIKKEKIEKDIVNSDLQEFIKQHEVKDLVIPKKKITVTSTPIKEIIESKLIKKDSKKESKKESKTESDKTKTKVESKVDSKDVDKTKKKTKSGSGFKFGNKEIFLNEEQQKVVEEDIESNIKIVASAGSGKTTTILCRIKYLTMKGVDPSRILCVTFNVDSAQNLKNRIKDLFGKETKIWIGTMDSIAFRFYKMFMPSTNFVGISEYSTMLLEFLKGKDKDKILSKFDYVFFDEFQDINKVKF